jgi:uncharacterized damage-inducible protein DinB
MVMNSLVGGLCTHQLWADAEHWSVIEAYSPAATDQAIRSRLHHIHQVQRGFVWALASRDTDFAITKPEDFASLPALKAYAGESHHQFARLLETMTDARLEERIAIPWFRNPALSITVAEALTQCAMHSHYHRGQNATRVRELGGEPPPTDLIVWYWKGRPAPQWTSLA